VATGISATNAHDTVSRVLREQSSTSLGAPIDSPRSSKRRSVLRSCPACGTGTWQCKPRTQLGPGRQALHRLRVEGSCSRFSTILRARASRWQHLGHSSWGLHCPHGHGHRFAGRSPKPRAFPVSIAVIPASSSRGHFQYHRFKAWHSLGRPQPNTCGWLVLQTSCRPTALQERVGLYLNGRHTFSAARC
jgi:hypothetical protein